MPNPRHCLVSVWEILPRTQPLFYLHPTAGLARPRSGPIGDAEQRTEPKTSRKYAVHVLPVDSKRVPFEKVGRTTVRKWWQKTKPCIIDLFWLSFSYVTVTVLFKMEIMSGNPCGWKKKTLRISFFSCFSCANWFLFSSRLVFCSFWAKHG